jgi:DNA-binding MarR family transcriptional regulator
MMLIPNPVAIMTLTELNTARYHGLNLTDLQVLLILSEAGTLEMGELTERVGLTNAALTSAAKRLVAKHLITRCDKAHWRDDGRIVRIRLAELGRVRVHQITGKFPYPDPDAKPQAAATPTLGLRLTR